MLSVDRCKMRGNLQFMEAPSNQIEKKNDLKILKAKQ